MIRVRILFMPTFFNLRKKKLKCDLYTMYGLSRCDVVASLASLSSSPRSEPRLLTCGLLCCCLRWYSIPSRKELVEILLVSIQKRRYRSDAPPARLLCRLYLFYTERLFRSNGWYFIIKVELFPKKKNIVELFSGTLDRLFSSQTSSNPV